MPGGGKRLNDCSKPATGAPGSIAAGAVVEQDPHRRRLLERGEGGGVVGLLLDRVVAAGGRPSMPITDLVDGRRHAFWPELSSGFCCAT